jgi:hypothetical protein
MVNETGLGRGLGVRLEYDEFNLSRTNDVYVRLGSSPHRLTEEEALKLAKIIFLR